MLPWVGGRGNARTAPSATANCSMSRLRTGRSGDNVGNDAVRELLDLILERQLAFLHPGKLKLVAIASLAHPLNLLVQAPVFNLEQGQQLPWVIVVHALNLQEARTIV